MLSRLLKNIGLEALDEIGDEIGDHLFGDLKEYAVMAAFTVCALLLFWMFKGAEYFFG